MVNDKLTTATLTRGADGALTLRSDGEAKAQRESRRSDLFIGNNQFAALTPLCTLAGPTGKTLSAFPGVAVTLAPVTRRALPVERLGAPAIVELQFVVADLAQSTRLELLCEGEKLVALRQPLAQVVAARPGYEGAVAALAKSDRKKPPIPAGLKEIPVVVTAPGDARLACSLLVPENARGPLPGMVFITGSGPQDRDEDTPGEGGLKLSIFKTLAIALAQAGIASLRCDDRGVAESTGDLKTATLDTLVGDTRATVDALRKQPGIDPARIGLIGHSEGGVIAPIVAAADPRLRALVLMAGTGRPLDQVILEQTEAGLRRAGVAAEQIEAQLTEQRKLFALMRAGKPLPQDLDAATRAAVAAATPWLHSHFLHDPAAQARKLGKIPVLIAQGGRDLQVSQKDAELLRDAFARAGNRDVETHIYPTLNHLFSATATGSLADYSDPNAKLDQGFIGDVVSFLQKRLSPHKQ
jgi:dienelactone hydrolase